MSTDGGPRAWIGCDVGGQSAKAVLLAADGSILAEHRETTGRDVDARGLVDAIHAIDARLSATPARVERTLGVGIAGVMASDGVLAGSPNLPNLVGHRVRDLLSEGLSRPVAIDNDANCAALAEACPGGAADGVADFLLVTLGSGVGSGLVLGGALWHGSTGYACELGHSVIVNEGRLCGCGNRGCLEAYVSESAARAMVSEHGGVLAAKVSGYVLDRGYGHAQAVFALADDGEPAAVEIADRMVDHLGAGLASAVNVLDVTTIIVGGGIAPAVLSRVARLRRAMDRSLFARAESRIDLLAASRGTDAGAVGAARLAALAS